MKFNDEDKYNLYEDFYNLEEYNLFFEGKILKCLLSINTSHLILSIGNYETNYNLETISNIVREKYNSLDEAFEYINKQFNDFEIRVKYFEKGKMIILHYYILIGQELKEIELSLIYKQEKHISIIKRQILKLKYLESKVKNLIEEFQTSTKKTIQNLSNYEIDKFNQNLDLNFKTIQPEIDFEDPNDIIYSKDLISDSFAGYSFNNSFALYNSVDDKINLIYSTKKKTLIKFDLKENKIVQKIIDAHSSYITNIKHFYEKIKNRDLILTISKKDNDIKLWNAFNLSIICDIQNIYGNNFLYSACFLEDNNETLIVTSNGFNRQRYEGIINFEPLKVFNSSGEKVIQLDFKDCTYFIDSYYDIKLRKKFLITGNYNYVKSYNYDEKSLYHRYFDYNNGIHSNVIIINFENKTKLLDLCEDGYLRIWQFHFGKLEIKIKIDNNKLYGMCLWNNNYIFVGCKDQTIKVIKLEDGLLIKSLNGHKGRIITLNKMKNSNGEEFLLSQGLDNKIILWKNQKNNKN